MAIYLLASGILVVGFLHYFFSDGILPNIIDGHKICKIVRAITGDIISTIPVEFVTIDIRTTVI